MRDFIYHYFFCHHHNDTENTYSEKDKIGRPAVITLKSLPAQPKEGNDVKQQDGYHTNKHDHVYKSALIANGKHPITKHPHTEKNENKEPRSNGTQPEQGDLRPYFEFIHPEHLLNYSSVISFSNEVKHNTLCFTF
jgi:hypothetical protein